MSGAALPCMHAVVMADEALADLIEFWIGRRRRTKVLRARSGGEALNLLHGGRASLVLGHLSCDPAAVFDVAREAQSLDPRVPVVLLASRVPLAWISAAIEYGVAAFLGPDAKLEDLERAIAGARKGERAFSPMAAVAMSEVVRRGLSAASFSKDERDVLELASLGCSLKETARRLAVTPKHVEYVRARLMARTGTRNATDLVRFAASEGFVSLEGSRA